MPGGYIIQHMVDIYTHTHTMCCSVIYLLCLFFLSVWYIHCILFCFTVWYIHHTFSSLVWYIELDLSFSFNMIYSPYIFVFFFSMIYSPCTVFFFSTTISRRLNGQVWGIGVLWLAAAASRCLLWPCGHWPCCGWLGSRDPHCPRLLLLGPALAAEGRHCCSWESISEVLISLWSGLWLLTPVVSERRCLSLHGGIRKKRGSAWHCYSKPLLMVCCIL